MNLREGRRASSAVVLTLLLLLPATAAFEAGHPSAGAVPTPSPAAAGVRPLGHVPWGSVSPSSLLTSVSVVPTSSSVTVGGQVDLTATPTCVLGPCPAGLAYSWSLNRNLGTLGHTQDLTNKAIATIPTIGKVPTGIAYDGENGDLYVTNDDAWATTAISNVSVVSGATNTLLKLIPVGASPSGIGYDPANGDLYVTDCGTHNMSVISGALNTVVATFPFNLSGCTIGSKMFMNFAGVAYDPVNREIYASNYGYGTVSALNTTTEQVTQTIYVGGDPWGIVYDPVSRDMYVSQFNVPYVAVINGTTNTLLTQVQVSELPSGIDVDGATGNVYVADASYWVPNPAGDGNVAVIRGADNTLLTFVPTRGYPWTPAYDPANGCIYETDSNTTVMNVLSASSNALVGTVAVGKAAWGYSNDFADTYDARNGYVYVTGFNASEVTAIGGAPDLDTFTAGGTAGTETVFLNTTWNGTTVASTPVTLTILASARPIVEGFGASQDPVALQERTYLNVSAVGGTGAITYGYTGLPSGCSSSDTPALYCVPTATGNYTVRVFVNDSAGNSASATTGLQVVAAITISLTQYTISPPLVLLGKSAVFLVVASGGQGPLTYAYAGLPPGCASADTPSLSCLPTQSGTFFVRAYVNDTVGHSETALARFTVTLPTPSLVGVAISPAQATVGTGGQVTFTAKATCTLSTCPIQVAYAWSLSLDLGTITGYIGAVTTFRAGSTLGSVSLILLATLGNVSRRANTTITIVEAPPTPPANTTGFLGLPGDEGYLLLAAPVAAALVLAFVLLRRRRAGGKGPSGPEKPKPSPEPADEDMPSGSPKGENPEADSGPKEPQPAKG